MLCLNDRWKQDVCMGKLQFPKKKHEEEEKRKKQSRNIPIYSRRIILKLEMNIFPSCPSSFVALSPRFYLQCNFVNKKHSLSSWSWLLRKFMKIMIFLCVVAAQFKESKSLFRQKAKVFMHFIYFIVKSFLRERKKRINLRKKYWIHDNVCPSNSICLNTESQKGIREKFLRIFYDFLKSKPSVNLQKISLLGGFYNKNVNL